MKIIFFGTSEFAVPALKKLKESGYEIAAVVTVPDQPVGRKKILAPPPVKRAALELGLPILQPASLKDDPFFEQFTALAADLAIVAAYGKIIPERYLSVPKHGMLNIHPSLLPKYRGPTPVQSALLNGDKETGVTIMVVDNKMDHGPIVAQEKYDIWPKTTYLELHDELSQLGAKLLIDSISKFISGVLKPQEQDHSQATICKIYTREDGKINWTNPGEQIFNQVRALNPEPGTWTTWDGKIFNIKKIALAKTQGDQPGLVSLVDNNIVVSTGTCHCILEIVQYEGRTETDARSFLAGHRQLLGSRLQ